MGIQSLAKMLIMLFKPDDNLVKMQFTMQNQITVIEKLLCLYMHDFENYEIIFPTERKYDSKNPKYYLDLKSHRFSMVNNSNSVVTL